MREALKRVGEADGLHWALGPGVAGVSTHLVHKYVAGHLRRALLERARSVALEAEAQEQRDKLIDVVQGAAGRCGTTFGGRSGRLWFDWREGSLGALLSI